MLTDAPPQGPPPSSPQPRVKVRLGPRTLELRDEEVFGAGDAGHCVRFLQRVFAVPEVDSVRVDRPSASALIRYRRGALGAADLLQKLADAIRDAGATPTDRSPPFRLLPGDLSGPNWTIHRHARCLSTWEVVTDGPGLLGLRHDLVLADDARAQRIARAMEAVHGVSRVAVRPLSGTLRIRFDPRQTQVERLLHALEAASLATPAGPVAGPLEVDPPPVSFALANTSVALAVVTDFVAPALWPVTAALLVGSNLGTFRDAASQLGRGELGLPVLYTGIAAATLATGQFAPWAAMGWMMRFWKHRYQQELVAARRRLLGDLLQQQRFARLEAAGGVEVEVPWERLGPGDVILVSAGEKLPLDGHIVGGHGLVDERAVRGSAGLSRKQPDDPMLAGSLVLKGDFRVEARPSHAPRRAEILARAALAALASPPGQRTPSRRGEDYASRFVAPTLATAGVGLFLGGPPMALAIMRTDYASGPGLSYPLETLQAFALCTRQGILLRDPDALDRLAAIDVVLLDQHPALEAAEPEVAGVRVFPGYTEAQVLQYAATAWKDLDDERGGALHAACRERRIAVLDRIPIEYGPDVTLVHREQVIKVGNLGTQHLAAAVGRSFGRAPAPTIDSLMVGINGQIAGLIDFRLSDRLKAAGALRELRAQARRPVAIGLVSAAEEPRIRGLAARLGVDFHRGGLAAGELVPLIRGCRRRGLKVAYVGNCLSRPRAAREADLAIAVDEAAIDRLDSLDASIVLLQPDLGRLAALDEVARLHRRRVRAAQGSALIPNVFCAAGALFLGFTSLTTVLVTNLGTYSTYARTTAAIRQLEQQLKRGGGRIARSLRRRAATGPTEANP